MRSAGSPLALPAPSSFNSPLARRLQLCVVCLTTRSEKWARDPELAGIARKLTAAPGTICLVLKFMSGMRLRLLLQVARAHPAANATASAART